MSPRHLVIMVKDPRPGRVKTRLAADIGAVDATWWYRHQTRRMIRALRDPRWTLWLAVAPDRAARTSAAWPPALPRLGQGTGDLGRRMTHVFNSLPKGRAIIVGSDIPGIEKRHIAHAFQTLGGRPFVFGAAPDGGYWLIGASRLRPLPAGLFHAVRWSSRWALSDTLATLQGAPAGFAATLQDVDTGEDLRRVRGTAKAQFADATPPLSA